MLGRLFAVFVFVGSSAVAAETELNQFFPSAPIHEDDRLSGSFEADIVGCRITLTEKSGAFRTVRVFNVRDYATEPELIARPFAEQLSTRYNVTWVARLEPFDDELDQLNAKLQDLRVSWRERRSLSQSELQARSLVLGNWLSEIRSGDHGSFAERNHTTRYITKDQDILIAVRINTAMEFPVQSVDIPSLAHAVHRHALNCS